MAPLNLEPGGDAHQLMGGCLLVAANVFPLVAYEATEDVYSEARCIQTSRALIDLLSHYKLPARPMPVDIVVSNILAKQHDHARTPRHLRPDNAWTVGVTSAKPARPGGWNGHLLVNVAQRWMLDANAGQFSRPGLIRMPRTWKWPYPDGWTRRTEGEWTQFGMSGDGATPNDHDYAVIDLAQQPGNLGYQSGSAYDPTPDAYLEPLIVIVDHLRAGTLPPKLVLTAGGEQVGVDTRALLARWELDGHPRGN